MRTRLFPPAHAGRIAAVSAVLMLSCALRARTADKPATWIEVRTAHFTVYSDGSEKAARQIALQFEQVRDAFLQILQKVRVDPGQPILILAAKDEKSLAALLPEDYEEKGHVHPAGVFAPGPERNYVSLRTDVEGDLPFRTLYHEYTHQVTRLNSRFLPTWLEEGYADFFGNSLIVDRHVTIGWAPEGDLEFLRQTRLLPLEQLFAVDHKSPYYNEANKISIFYEESWALVHMLFFDPQLKKAKALDTYIAAVNDGVDPVEAGRRAFGDLSALQRHLEAYIREESYEHLQLNSPIEQMEKTFAVRTLSDAEADVMLGDYYLNHDRKQEATQRLAEAAKLDPNSASANEGLGLLKIRQNDREAAAPYFERAVQLHSQSFLTYYYHADLILEASRSSPDAAGEAAKSLEKCAALNPNFAPAFAVLAQLYSRQAETLDKALKSAQTAVSLDPTSWQYELTLATVDIHLKKLEPARAIATRVAATATGPAARDGATAILHVISQTEQYNARMKDNGRANGNAAPDISTQDDSARPVLKRRADLNTPDSPPTPEQTSSEETPGGATSDTAALNTVRIYSMTGRIALADCSSPPEAILTLTMVDLTMKLHADDLSSIAFSSAGASGQTPPPACNRFQGMSAKVSYTLVNEKPYDGEIKSIDQQP